MTDPQYASDLHTGFILAEDAAMKDKVSGIKLRLAQIGDKDVPVRFRYPEGERNPDGDLTRRSGVTYPLITIDMVSITYDAKRDHAGNVYVWHDPDQNWKFEDGKPGVTEYPLPVRLFYRVTTWATTQQHQIGMQSQMMQPKRLPLRHGYLYVPADNTIRRMDSMGMQVANFIDDQNRRMFRSVYSVYVEAEVLKTEIAHFHQVTSVILDPPLYQPGSFIGVTT